MPTPDNTGDDTAPVGDAMSVPAVPAVLIELPGVRWTDEDARGVRRRNPGLVIDILTAVSEDETWMYIPEQEALDPALFDEPGALLREILPPEMLTPGAEGSPGFRARRLHVLNTIGDPAEGLDQPWHYTSQMSVPDGVEPEFNRWFDEEHLPRLAAVPGTVQATRYRTDGTPRYLAGYDLTRQEVRGGEAWRAALVSPWRDRMHHEFIDPRRMMFSRLR